MMEKPLAEEIRQPGAYSGAPAPDDTRGGEDRPWYRQRWLTIIAGFALAFLTGMALAQWVKHYGDWHNGMRWERQLMLALHLPLPRWLDAVIYIVPWTGTNISLLPGVLVAVVWLWARAHRPHLAMRLLVTQMGSYLLNPALKDLYDRARPDLFERRGWYGWSSYPSGHAIASVAVLLTIAMMLHDERGWRWPFYVVGTLIPLSLYSRLYLGVHWPTDVIGGALVGLVWLAMTTVAFREQHRGASAAGASASIKSPSAAPDRHFHR